jgi:3'(2'), 5'-bisphosphate nucleotidase/inositol polyphosphate 1-phosphatase
VRRGDENRALRERIATLVTEVIQEEDSSVTLSVEEVIELIDTGKSAGGADGRHWVLDPIDGTRGFVGGRQYAVCLGLIDAGEVVVGVLGCPNMPMQALTDVDGTAAASAGNQPPGGVCFAARKGNGAAYGPLHAMTLPASPMVMDDSTVDGFAGARFMESYESRHSQHGLTQQVRSSSAQTLKFALL